MLKRQGQPMRSSPLPIECTCQEGQELGLPGPRALKKIRHGQAQLHALGLSDVVHAAIDIPCWIAWHQAAWQVPDLVHLYRPSRDGRSLHHRYERR